MKQLIKYILKTIFPESVLKKIWKFSTWCKTLHARFRFALAKPNTELLGWNDLDKLQKYYPYRTASEIPPLEEAKSRAENMLAVIPDNHRIHNVLETGSGNCLVSLALKQMGKDAYAIDLNPEKIDARAKTAGVKFQQMDVMNMSFQNEIFDCVFSFFALEHFMQPDKALKEMLRVLKKNGCLYLDFGPPYFSPLGLHIYRCISVPYCQFLFDYGMMMNYIKENNLRRPVEKTLNKFSIRNYEQLWKKFSDCTKIVYQRKYKNYSHLDLVKKYAPLFKAQTHDFQDLVVTRYCLVLRKTQPC